MEYGKVIGAAAGNIADGHPDILPGKAGEGLIQGTVAAGAADQVIVPAQRCGKLRGLAPAGGDTGSDQITIVHQPADNVGDVLKHQLLAGDRVDNQQRFFIEFQCHGGVVHFFTLSSEYQRPARRRQR